MKSQEKGWFLSRYLALALGLLIIVPQISRAQSPPPNDDFANRFVLTGTNAIMEGTLSGATLETNEPLHSTNATGGSVWWTWTAPADGIVGIADLPNFPAYSLAQAVAVYEGDSLDSLQQVTVFTALFFQPAFFLVSSNQTYQIAVVGRYPGDPRQVELSLTLYDNPTNDSFQTSSPLIVGQTNIVCSYFDTLEQEALWWNWTAPVDGVLELQTFGDSVAPLFTGTDVSNLVSIGWGPTSFGNYGYEVHAGEVLYVQAGENIEDGATEFAWSFNAELANDQFTNSIVLSGLPAQASGDITYALPEPGEPSPMGKSPAHTLWYQWTAPTTGQFGIMLGGSATVVSVYTGNSVSNLAVIAGKKYSAEPIIFQATAGRTYSILVGGNAGPFQLTIVAAPPNDNFASATELTGWNAETNSYTTCATMQPGEQPLTKYDSHQSIWWSWQAPYSGWVDLSLAASYPVPLEVFTGSTLRSLRLVPYGNYNPTFGLTTAAFQAQAGTIYYIRATGIRVMENHQLVIMSGPIDLSLALNTLQASVAGGSNLIVGQQNVTIQTQTNGILSGDPVALTFTAIIDLNHDPIVGTISGPPWQYTFTNMPCGLYQVTVSGTNADGVAIFAPPFTLRVSPQNDNFANSLPMPALPGGPNGTFAGATLEPGEPKFSHADTASTWFYWTPSNSAPFEVTLYDGSLQIFEGDSFANLHLVKSAANGTFVFNAVSNHTYQLRCSTASDPERSTYTVVFAQKYTNDNFADRITLTGSNVTFIADNSAATTQPGEPPPHKPSLWWTWTSPGDGYIVVTRTNMNTSYPIYLGIYTGTDFKNMQIVYAETNLGEPPASVLVPVHAGTNYQIAAEAEMPLADMLVTFNLQFTPGSTNDNFADRIAITDSNLVFSGENYSATLESNEPPEFVGQPPTQIEATLWWQWTAATNGTATINYLSGSLKPFVAVYQGTDLASLTNLAANTTYFVVPTSYTFTAQAGQTYDISVGAGGSARGQFVLQLIPPGP